MDLVEFLGAHSPIPVTYAGGARSLEDLQQVTEVGKGRVSERGDERQGGYGCRW